MTDDKEPDFSDVEGGASSTAPEAETTYTVVRGDTLSKIAEREYGDAKLWRKIFQHNKDVIENPDKIFPGQILKLPSKAGFTS